jgi:hypothetical protein
MVWGGGRFRGVWAVMTLCACINHQTKNPCHYNCKNTQTTNDNG